VLSGLMPLLLIGAASVMVGTVYADAVKENPMLEIQQMRSAAKKAQLRTNVDPTDGDTVWVGHVFGTHSVPWSANPNWTGWGPFHTGRGGYRIGNNSPKVDEPPNYSGAVSNNGYWDFDRFNAGETDTLQGWWSVSQPHASIGGFVGNDREKRWFMCFDFGNNGNHRSSDHGGKKNYGVISYWHVDNGSTLGSTVANTNPLAPGWAPIAGAGSAWCGLRGHGDLTVSDPITGNAYNATLVNNYGDNHFRQTNAAHPGGSDNQYPGYGSQWDQIMYRDFVIADGAGMTLAFDYQTSLSTGKAADPNGNLYGWYQWDPLKVPALNDGNFISGSDAGAAAAPRDSFMVYIGTPVNDNSWRSSDNAGGPGVPVYDKQRRWFSEVIDMYAPVAQVLSTTGVMGSPANASFNIPNAIIQPILNAQAGSGGTVRVVFRVKTDRAFDDEDFGQRGFQSSGRGAVLLDNVNVNGSLTTFDAGSAIDNAIATAPTAAWKATGKPLAANWHWHNLENNTPYTNLVYYDPCGAIGSPNRLCDMRGNVISNGNHDDQERINGGYGAWDQVKQDWFISPTINLMATGNGPGFYNEQGIDQEIADATRDIRLRFDIYTHGFDLVNSGGGIRIAWASYPVTQPNGSKTWGVKKLSSFSSYTFTYGCFGFANPSGATGKLSALIQTTNANGVPDSLRALVERLSVCFRNTASVAQCGPDQSDPAGGGYVDNLTIGFVDGAAASPLSQQPWDIFGDAFPSNSNDALVGTANFDTTAAKMKSGYNQATPTGSAAPYRPVIPGDSMYVQAPGSNIRLDLVFRIYPGVGNYMTVGDRNSGLRRRPDVPGVQATAGDGSYWGSLLNDVGLYGTYKVPGAPNTLPGSYRMVDINPALPNANTWDPNIWVSVRMDTLEKSAAGVGNATAVTGNYQTSVHESDLGRPIGTDVADIHGAGRRSSWYVGGEYVKILPDGQFTPGTHIEYFFRRTFINNLTAYQLMPDTTAIYPQTLFGGGNFEGIRFASSDVLPDRWKDPSRPGNPPFACMLVANYGYRRGDGVLWDNMARAIGLTLPAKVGAGGHGYFSSPTGDLPANITDANVGGLRSANLGSEGSLYDMYDVIAGESNVPAGRLGNRIALGTCTGGQSGMCATSGPTPRMLRYYYSNLIILGADLGSNTWGPFIDQSDNDIGLFTDFITNPAGAGGVNGALRFMSMMSFDIGSGLDGQVNTASFLPDFFGADFRSDDYRTDSGSTNDAPDLLTTGSPAITNGAIYGVFSPCFLLTDAFDVSTTATGAAAAAYYENTGTGDPWVGAVYMPQDVANGRYAKTLVMGWTYGTFGGPGTVANGLGQQGSRFSINRGGLHTLWLNMLTNMVQGCTSFGQPVGIGDLPGQGGASFVNFLNLRSENPMRSGAAKISFGIVKTEKVEVSIFDVSGRRVKTLTNRVFEGGKMYDLTWDGTNEDGASVARGVYFYQLRSPSFTSQKKLTVLRD
jgi:hypothetical protein